MRHHAAACLLAVLTAGCGSDGPAVPPVGGGRVVAIRATDALRFEPATLTAKPSEKITFEITNAGQIEHEFTIGDEAYQRQHEDETGGGHGSGGHGSSGNGASIKIAPGTTVRLDYTMPADKAPVYACHINRHDDAGMRGTVTYTG